MLGPRLFTFASDSIRVLPRHGGSRPNTVVVELSEDAVAALVVAVEVAFDDPSPIPDPLKPAAAEWWEFAAAAELARRGGETS